MATDIKTWLDKQLAKQTVTPSLRKEITASLRYAGFQKGVDKGKENLAIKVVEAVIARANNQRQATVRQAAVVTAGSPCPACGSDMVTAELAQGTPVSYCPKCRVSAYVRQ